MEGWAATRRNRPALVVILKLIKRKAFSYFFIFFYILHVSSLRLEVLKCVYLVEYNLYLLNPYFYLIQIFKSYLN